MMVICCKCGRWWYGPKADPQTCPGTPYDHCGHIRCTNCGTGELTPERQRILTPPSTL